MNNAITENKSTLERTKSRITQAEERISEMEYRKMEINEAERKKNTNKDNLRDLWDNVKCPNIQILSVPEKTKRKGMRKYWRR